MPEKNFDRICTADDVAEMRGVELSDGVPLQGRRSDVLVGQSSRGYYADSRYQWLVEDGAGFRLESPRLVIGDGILLDRYDEGIIRPSIDDPNIGERISQRVRAILAEVFNVEPDMLNETLFDRLLDRGGTDFYFNFESEDPKSFTKRGSCSFTFPSSPNLRWLPHDTEGSFIRKVDMLFYRIFTSYLLRCFIDIHLPRKSFASEGQKLEIVVANQYLEVERRGNSFYYIRGARLCYDEVLLCPLYLYDGRMVLENFDVRFKYMNDSLSVEIDFFAGPLIGLCSYLPFRAYKGQPKLDDFFDKNGALICPFPDSKSRIVMTSRSVKTVSPCENVSFDY